MKISLKAGAAAVCIVFAVLMLPVLATCFYTYPMLDDFNFSVRTHQAVLDGTSVLWAALQNAHSFYMNWQGNYTSNFLAGIQPFIWNVRLYCLSNLAVFTAICGGTLFFFYVLLCKTFACSKSQWLLFTVPLLLVFWEWIPSLAEGLYWMDGSLTLSLQSLIYIEFALFILHSRKPAPGVGYWIGASLLTVIFCGDDFGNLLSFMIVCAACLFVPQVRKSSTGKLIALQILLALISLAISILAPGNQTRMSDIGGISTVSAIMHAVYYGFACFDIWCRLVFLGALLVGCTALYPALRKSQFSFGYPLLVAIVCFGFYAAPMAVVFRAKGTIGDDRQLNCYYLSFIAAISVLAVYLTGWMSKRLNVKSTNTGTISMAALTVAAICTAATLCGSGFRNLATVDTAWGFYKGYTQQYAAEMQARTEILENPEITDVYLEPLSLTLTYLPTEPLEAGSDFWTNKSTAAFYRKNSVSLIN